MRLLYFWAALNADHKGYIGVIAYDLNEALTLIKEFDQDSFSPTSYFNQCNLQQPEIIVLKDDYQETRIWIWG